MFPRLSILVTLSFCACSGASGPAPTKSSAGSETHREDEEYVTASGESVVALRSLELAKRIPLFVGAEVIRYSQSAPPKCEGGAEPPTLVVLTTYGALGSHFADYPLALDAWECAPGVYQYPVELSESDFRRLMAAAVKAGQTGDFDKAEYCFRRVVNAFPKFGDGHLNLASTYVDRIGRSGRGPTDLSISTWIAQARQHLELAVAGDPPAQTIAKLMLARLYANTGEAAKARPLLEQVVNDSNLAQEARDEAKSLLEVVQQ